MVEPVSDDNVRVKIQGILGRFTNVAVPDFEGWAMIRPVVNEDTA